VGLMQQACFEFDAQSEDWGASAPMLEQCDEPKPVAGESDVNDHGRTVLVNWVGTGATLRAHDGLCPDGDSFWAPNLLLIQSKLLAGFDVGIDRLAVTSRPDARRHEHRFKTANPLSRNQIRRSAAPQTGPRAAFANAVATPYTGGGA
jgi:hypothetical protein